jgi:hypothetical protein
MSVQNNHHERGVVLMTALLFAMTILAFSASVITSGVATANQTRYLIAKQRALSAAESGAYQVLARLNGPQRSKILAAGKFEGAIEGDEDSTRRVRYLVTLGSGAADGADNDLDGTIDEDDEADILEVVSTGYADNLTRTIRATMLARHRSPTLPGSVYIANPLGDFRFNGNSFLISGRDVDLNGNETGELVPGIGVAGSADLILDALSGTQLDNVIGLGGTGSVSQVAPVDLAPFIDDGVRSANVVLNGDGNHRPAAEGDWGTIDNPTIVFGRGNIHISGGAAGAGLLIVDGNLKVTGSFEWRGIVIVRGDVEFSGGGNTKRVVGGVIVERDVTNVSFGGDLTTSGTIDLLYSEATISRTSAVFASYSILNWREGPTPEGATP